jgi:uncharacterized protein
MRLSIAGLVGGTVGDRLDFDLPLRAAKWRETPEVKKIGATGAATQLGDRILLTGRTAARLELECARCLRRFTQPLEIDFSEEFAAVPTGEQFGFTADELDLSTMLRTHVVLATPIRPLHQPDCKGLCPVCGKDLNERPHTHRGAAKPIDHPSAGLKKLRK